MVKSAPVLAIRLERFNFKGQVIQLNNMFIPETINIQHLKKEGDAQEIHKLFIDPKDYDYEEDIKTNPIVQGKMSEMKLQEKKRKQHLRL